MEPVLSVSSFTRAASPAGEEEVGVEGRGGVALGRHTSFGSLEPRRMDRCVSGPAGSSGAADLGQGFN